jgi:Tfp pilus assembly protein PilV
MYVLTSLRQKLVRCQKGAGLVEIMIAILVFTLGLSVVMRVLPSSNFAATRGRNITKATNLAQEKVEALMGVPLSDADLNAGTHSDPENPIDTHFRRSWSVTDDDPVVGMKKVSVRVSFPTSSTDSSVTLQTYVTSRR